MKRWNGTEWVNADAFAFDGAEHVEIPIMVWNGSDWVQHDVSWLYNGGDGEDNWVEGYTYGDTTLTKYSSWMRAYADGMSEATWVTDNTVDLTDVSSIEIDWEQQGVDETSVMSALVVDDSKTSSLSTYDGRLYREGAFSQTTESLDVSSISGEKYVRVHARNGNDFYISDVAIFSVGLMG